jgi:hypothetical protein
MSRSSPFGQPSRFPYSGTELTRRKSIAPDSMALSIYPNGAAWNSFPGQSPPLSGFVYWVLPGRGMPKLRAAIPPYIPACARFVMVNNLVAV